MAKDKKDKKGSAILEELTDFLSTPRDELSERQLSRVHSYAEEMLNNPEILWAFGIETDPEEFQRINNIFRAAKSRLENQFGLPVQDNRRFHSPEAMQQTMNDPRYRNPGMYRSQSEYEADMRANPQLNAAAAEYGGPRRTSGGWPVLFGRRGS